MRRSAKIAVTAVALYLATSEKQKPRIITPGLLALNQRY
jgi:hypothetical protein